MDSNRQPSELGSDRITIELSRLRWHKKATMPLKTITCYCFIYVLFLAFSMCKLSLCSFTKNVRHHGQANRNKT